MTKKWTNPEIFKKVCEHLISQGQTAYDMEEGQCAYRTDEGLSCAVGCLIPDKLYTSKIEGATVGWTFKSKFPKVIEKQKLLVSILRRSGIQKRSFKLLRDLQLLHDNTVDGDFPEGYLKNTLTAVAKKFKIRQPDVLKELNV